MPEARSRRAASHDRGHLHRWGPAAAAVLVAAGALAALRVDLIRVRYDLQTVQDREAELEAERSELTVSLRQLRDPARLGEEARKRGFGPPQHLLELAPEAAAPPTAHLAATHP